MNKLELDKDFFCAQERDGFFVEGMMKRAWAAQLEVLMVINEICQKHNITWFADWGTLLGAVRHGGFIPWDDDIDISLFRPDYDKLLYFLERELPEGYIIRCPVKRAYSNIFPGKQPFARVENSYQSLNYEKAFLCNFHGCPYSSGVDIFPLAGISDDREEAEVLFDIILILIDAYYQSKKEIISEERIIEIENICKIKIDRSEDYKTQFLLILADLSNLYSIEECKNVTNLYFVREVKNPFLDKRWFDSIVMLPFENIEIPCPVGYKEVLQAYYGDYMIPVMGEASHDYPYYKNVFFQFREREETADMIMREDLFAKRMKVSPYEVKELSTIRRTTLADYYAYYYNGTYYINRMPERFFSDLFHWKREKDVLSRLSGAGLTVEMIYFNEEDGQKISGYLDKGAYMDPNKKEQVYLCLDKLHLYHSIEFRGENAISPIDLLAYYDSHFGDLMLQQKDFLKIRNMVEKYFQRINDYPSHNGLVHMNLSPKTFWFYPIDDTYKVVLLDFKYAGLGDADWDIGIFASSMFYDIEQIWELLDAYYKMFYDEKEMRDIYEKVVIYAMAASYVKGLEYRLLSNMQNEFRKNAFHHFKHVKYLLNYLQKENKKSEGNMSVYPN